MRPGETRQLTWAMVDSAAGTLTVAPSVAKTREGRTLAIVGPLREIVERRRRARIVGCDLVFHRPAQRRRGRGAGECSVVPGQPIRTYCKAWAEALRIAGLPRGLRPYDLRRSAIRHLLRSGTHERTVMAISGHKTRSTFDRYNITSVEDVAAAFKRAARK